MQFGYVFVFLKVAGESVLLKNLTQRQLKSFLIYYFNFRAQLKII